MKKFKLMENHDSDQKIKVGNELLLRTIFSPQTAARMLSISKDCEI